MQDELYKLSMSIKKDNDTYTTVGRVVILMTYITVLFINSFMTNRLLGQKKCIYILK